MCAKNAHYLFTSDRLPPASAPARPAGSSTRSWHARVHPRSAPRSAGRNASLAQALFVFSTFENLSPRPRRARARAPNLGRRSRTQGRAHAPLQPLPVFGEVSIEGLRVVLVSHCASEQSVPLLRKSKCKVSEFVGVKKLDS